MRAIKKVLVSMGRDYHWLAGLVEGARPEPVRVTPTFGAGWQEMLEFCSEDVNMLMLNAREMEFILSLHKQSSRRTSWYPSEKQENWLEAIYEKSNEGDTEMVVRSILPVEGAGPPCRRVSSGHIPPTVTATRKMGIGAVHRIVCKEENGPPPACHEVLRTSAVPSAAWHASMSGGRHGRRTWTRWSPWWSKLLC